MQQNYRGSRYTLLFHYKINCYCRFLFAAGNEGGVFAVDAFGNITVAKKLDRETKAAYELTITAQDRAGI